jgi:prepilin-type processing-associated H-X9-DG protein
MKQIGLALANYESTSQVFPMGSSGIGWCTGGLPANNQGKTLMNLCGLATMLPFLEQAPVYASINFSVAVCDYTRSGNQATALGSAWANTTAATTRLLPFLCPSDAGTGLTVSGYGPISSDTLKGQKTNYDFVGIDDRTCNNWVNYAVYNQPMFGENSNTRIASIRDGTSNTVSVMEKPLQVDDGDGSAWLYRSWVMCGVDLSAGINRWYSTWRANVPIIGVTAEYNFPGSSHPGGANALRADGSVVFLKQSTSVQVLRQLMMMADGGVISADAY